MLTGTVPTRDRFRGAGPGPDLLALVVPQWGVLQAGGTGRLVPRGAAACGRSASTQRSYGLALLRWFRFMAAVDVAWDQATRVEARDFCRWIQIAAKPVRPLASPASAELLLG